MVLLMNTESVLAKDEELQLKTDISFIEFLGEGVEVDREYIDPLRVREYEEMMSDVKQESKQQND